LWASVTVYTNGATGVDTPHRVDGTRRFATSITQ
jgi:hypothetical protein